MELHSKLCTGSLRCHQCSHTRSSKWREECKPTKGNLKFFQTNTVNITDENYCNIVWQVVELAAMTTSFKTACQSCISKAAPVLRSIQTANYTNDTRMTWFDSNQKRNDFYWFFLTTLWYCQRLVHDSVFMSHMCAFQYSFVTFNNFQTLQNQNYSNIDPNIYNWMTEFLFLLFCDTVILFLKVTTYLCVCIFW